MKKIINNYLTYLENDKQFAQTVDKKIQEINNNFLPNLSKFNLFSLLFNSRCAISYRIN